MWEGRGARGGGAGGGRGLFTFRDGSLLAQRVLTFLCLAHVVGRIIVCLVENGGLDFVCCVLVNVFWILGSVLCMILVRLSLVSIGAFDTYFSSG